MPLSFPSLIGEDNELCREYAWLLSKFDDLVWTVADPHGKQNLKRQTLTFSGVLAPGLDFKDYPQIVSDLKRSLVFAVELTRLSVKGGIKVSSLAKMRVYVSSLKRVYREVFAMRCTSIDQLTSAEVTELKRRLALPEEVSMDYEMRLTEFFANCHFDLLPINVYPKRKSPSTIDLEWLCRELGLNQYVLVHSAVGQHFIRLANGRLSKIYPEHRWEQPKAKGKKPILGQENMLADHLAALISYYYQGEVLNAFNHPLKHNPIERSINVDVQSLTAKQETRERTRNIPADQFLTVMDRAVRWVVEYADPLLRLEAEAQPVYSEYVRLDGKYTGGKKMNGYIREHTRSFGTTAKASPFPLAGYKTKVKPGPTPRKYSAGTVERLVSLREQGLKRKAICSELGLTESQYNGLVYAVKDTYKRSLRTTGISLNRALYEFLPLCCALILLAFTAGRESAVYNLKSGCVFKVLGSRYIRMYVPKTLRKEDDFPTVALVEKAVDILTRLSARAREINGDDRLFQFVDLLDRGSPKKFRFQDVINRFLDFIAAPKGENGEYFKFSEHQFRRFFAIMYFYRYDGGDYETLAWHLRHTDWSMTERYLSEKEAGLIFKVVEKERIASLVVRAADGDRVGGAMAEEFKRSLASTTRIEASNRFERAIEQVNRDSLVLDFVPSGLCFGRSPSRAERAKCLLVVGAEKHVMIHRASEALCKGCPNLLTCDEFNGEKIASGRSQGAIRCNSPILDAVIAAGGIS